MQLALKRFPARNLSEYFEVLRQKSITTNGIFGMKAIYEDFEPLLASQLVNRALGVPHILFLTRKDVAAQAISSYVARTKGLWHSTHMGRTEKIDVGFDRPAILKLIDRFMGDRMRWERFFSLYGVEPPRIEYEDLGPTTIAGQIERICEYIGIQSPATHAGLTSSLKILRDEKSIEWAAQIRSHFKL